MLRSFQEWCADAADHIRICFIEQKVDSLHWDFDHETDPKRRRALLKQLEYFVYRVGVLRNRIHFRQLKLV